MDVEEAVTTTLHAWRSSHFAWGFRDCLISVGEYGLLLKGIDPVERFRGQYDGEAAGRKFLTGLGFDTLADVLAQSLTDIGFKRVTDYRRGDALAVDFPGVGIVGGLHLGKRVALRLSIAGCLETIIPASRIVGAWRP